MKYRAAPTPIRHPVADARLDEYVGGVARVVAQLEAEPAGMVG